MSERSSVYTAPACAQRMRVTVLRLRLEEEEQVVSHLLLVLRRRLRPGPSSLIKLRTAASYNGEIQHLLHFAAVGAGCFPAKNPQTAGLPSSSGTHGHIALQGIDLEAGGRNKKVRRTAPKSENVYLKLLVKVQPPTVTTFSSSKTHQSL